MTGALAAEPVLKEVLKDVRAHRRGAAFFIHLLLPHSSYVLDRDGGLLSPQLWESAFSDVKGDGVLNTSGDRLRKYALYKGQVRWAHTKLYDFFNELRFLGIYEESTIILVGDHGSRIYFFDSRFKDMQEIPREDYEAAFSNFLAVKESGFSGGIVSDQVPALLVIGKLLGTLPPEKWQDPALFRVNFPQNKPFEYRPALMINMESNKSD